MNQIVLDVRKLLDLLLMACAIFVSSSIVTHAQQVVPKEGDCASFGFDEKKPLLFGREFKVPDLRFRFKNPGSESKYRPYVIRVFYVWKWLEYPYPESARGAWSEADDIIDCTNVTNSDFVVPAYSVIPKGWYSGEFANERKNLPRFDHIEVAFKTKECGAPRLLFNKKEIEKFRTRIALVSLPCGGLPKYEFIKN